MRRATERQQGDELHPGKEFSTTSPARKAVKNERSKPERDVGSSLRSIYRQTVEEDVPREMLDLLGKLD